MADPVGIVSLGITVLQGLIAYYRDLKDQDNDIMSLNTQLHRLLKIFTDIKSRIDETKNKLPIEKHRNVKSTLKECYAEVKGLEKKLQAIQTLDQPKGLQAKIKARFMRLRYPFDGKHTVLEIEKIASGLNGHIVAIMNVLQIDMALGMDKRMDGVAEDVGNVGRDVQNLQRAFENDRFLEKLPRAKGAAFDSQLWAHKSGCLQGTRVVLLNDIIEWCRSSADGPCIFWLCGMAGMGKSTIARTVSKTCDKEKRLGASFFFSKDDKDLRKAENFVTTIAFQLAKNIPDLKPLVIKVINNNADISEKSLEIQWKHLITDTLARLDKDLEGFVVIIDALDECEKNDDIQSILGVLAQANKLHTTRLKVFVTSRPETPIRKKFEDTKIMHQRQLLQDVPRNTIDHDIGLYFQTQLQDELKAGEVTPENLTYLVEKAGGLFIWAVTVCLFLQGAPAMKEERLKLLLTSGKPCQYPEEELDRIYTSILSSSIKDKYREYEYEKVFQQYKRIIGAIILVPTPVSMNTLSQLLLLSKKEIKCIIDDLHSVLDIPDDNAYPIRTLHLSFRDFLLSLSRCQDTNLRIDELQGHRSLLLDCLKCMSDKLRENMCGLPYAGFSSGDVKKEIIEKALPSEVQYACRYWIYHLQRSDYAVRDDDEIERFLERHFLHWFEALSLMGMVSEGIDAIRALESKVSSNENERLYKLSHDARRFITKHRKTIENAPLQIYSSALIFSPTGSIIRQHFAKKIPPWIKTLPLVQENWDPLLQTLEGHSNWVETLAFSPDGKTLASGSWDKTVRLWDPATGASRGTLEGHSGEVRALTFSPDGKTLASGSEDNTVRLWDPATGSSRGILEGHSEMVYTLAFSPDGKTLASGSRDNTVRLWDPATGASRGTLEGHSNSVETLAFSPDGKTLVSGSWDDTVRLWDPATGASRGTLEGHSNSVETLAFSPDGKILGNRQLSSVQLHRWGTSPRWITHEQHNILFLPVDVQPRCFSIYGAFLAWSDALGRMYIMELSSKGYNISI